MLMLCALIYFHPKKVKIDSFLTFIISNLLLRTLQSTETLICIYFAFENKNCTNFHHYPDSQIGPKTAKGKDSNECL